MCRQYRQRREAPHKVDIVVERPAGAPSSSSKRLSRARQTLACAFAAVSVLSVTQLIMTFGTTPVPSEAVPSTADAANPRRQPRVERLPTRTAHAYLPRSMGGYWVVRGVSYDLSSFVDKHPGGRRYLQNTINSDVTHLFESMHIGTTAANTLAQYRVDSVPALRSASQDVANRNYFALKRAIKASSDLNDLKKKGEPLTLGDVARTFKTNIEQIFGNIPAPDKAPLAAAWCQ